MSEIAYPEYPLRECIEKGHDVAEDMIVYEFCKERLFYCNTCKKIYICEEIRDPETNKVFLKVKKVLPYGVSNEVIAKNLTWLG